jgi:hypothetical protein
MSSKELLGATVILAADQEPRGNSQDGRERQRVAATNHSGLHRLGEIST